MKIRYEFVDGTVSEVEVSVMKIAVWVLPLLEQVKVLAAPVSAVQALAFPLVSECHVLPSFSSIWGLPVAHR